MKFLRNLVLNDIEFELMDDGGCLCITVDKYPHLEPAQTVELNERDIDALRVLIDA